MTVPINYVTSDFERWGQGKNVVLQPSEVDRNFYELATAVADLVSNPPSPVQIASFSIVGLGMVITMTNGSSVGPLPLPVLAWRWRSDWMPFVPYAALDVFQIDDLGIFLVLKDHTAAAMFDPAAIDHGNALYQQIFGAPGSTSGAVANALAAGCSQDWGVIGASISARADWGQIGTPVTLRIDLGQIGK